MRLDGRNVLSCQKQCPKMPTIQRTENGSVLVRGRDASSTASAQSTAFNSASGAAHYSKWKVERIIAGSPCGGRSCDRHRHSECEISLVCSPSFDRAKNAASALRGRALSRGPLINGVAALRSESTEYIRRNRLSCTRFAILNSAKPKPGCAAQQLHHTFT